ncbi:hypothetical protein J1N35_014878 [Gossypium stocksii]|uniref:DUF4283 domain-containing protein n=1 Tax=Gossypium stocksii TaxID=47602 RepID=A0A9D4AAB6_9ROSI|nr:hypothetical protein J1N35_014878 [Gossypium stocksii]
MEEEMTGINFEDGEEEDTLLLSIDPRLQKSTYEHCLVMKNTMANLWHPLGGVQILDLGVKRFLFKFFHEMDVDRVVQGSPQGFNNHLLIIHCLENGEDPL